MPSQIKSNIIFNASDSPGEMAYKLAEMQKQLDNRITALEKSQGETNKRLDQLED